MGPQRRDWGLIFLGLGTAVIVLGALVLFAVTRPAPIVEPLEAVQGPIYHWVPPSVQVIDATGSASWHAAISEAVGEWGSAGLSITLVKGPCDNAFDAIVFCLGNPGNGWTAATYFYLNGQGNLDHAKILALPDQKQLRKREISCHELSNGAGLGEVSYADGPTCRVNSLLSSEMIPAPGVSGYALLRATYPVHPPTLPAPAAAPSSSPSPSVTPSPSPNPSPSYCPINILGFGCGGLGVGVLRY